jgi:hypothetical protein
VIELGLLNGPENCDGLPDSARFPVNFPVSREFGAETGSQLTASSANQFRPCGTCLTTHNVHDIPSVSNNESPRLAFSKLHGVGQEFERHSQVADSKHWNSGAGV